MPKRVPAATLCSLVRALPGLWIQFDPAQRPATRCIGCTRLAARCSRNRMTSRRFQQTLVVGARTKRDGNSPAFSSVSMDDIDSGTNSSSSRRLRYSCAAAGRDARRRSIRAQVRQNLAQLLFAGMEYSLIRCGSICAALSICNVWYFYARINFAWQYHIGLVGLRDGEGLQLGRGERSDLRRGQRHRAEFAGSEVVELICGADRADLGG